MINNPLNRLNSESSAYLLQHASNPVHWYPWAEEALSEAVKSDKPILLSIGYAACHWCHVMEKESFEDEETAKIINEHFIAIKVDREERPDIDDIYMTAVQLMTGRGGWPLTIFLTPQLKPFYGGTYFPKENKQYGQQVMPGFQTILKAVNQSWIKQRREIESSAENITAAINTLSEQIAGSESDNTIGSDNNLSVEAGLRLLTQFDKQWGGFGKAPKFPQALCLFLCLRLAAKLKYANDTRWQLFSEVLNTSLNCMARGGIYDHLGGGFARYATDAKWLVPHFEKMLYDNALLAQVYLDAYTFTKTDHWRIVGCETLDFIDRELGADEGGFYSSLDADSEGEEGKFYLFEKAEISNVLGADSDLFCQMFSITEEGNFEPNKNIIYQDADHFDSMTNEPIDTISGMKEKLFAYRAQRVHPGLDKKILTSWNGLAISAFVSGYKVSGFEKYLERAKKAAHFILDTLCTVHRLKHCYAGGTSKLSAYLDDYVFFVQALIDLASVDANPIWLKKALDFTESVLEHFYDQKQADFFYTANDQEKLIARTKNSNDGPLPSAASVAIFNLIKLSTLTGNDSYRQHAETVLQKYMQSFVRLPTQYANMAAAWDNIRSLAPVLIFVGSASDKLDKAMLHLLHSQYVPDKLVVVKENRHDQLSDKMDNHLDKRLTIFCEKTLLNNQPTVYLCNKYGCQPPVNNIDSLNQLLKTETKL